MRIKKILEKVFYTLLFIGVLLLSVHYSLKSDFANMKNTSAGKDGGITLRSEYAKESNYYTKFRKDINNENVLSLGNYTVNVNNEMKTTKLIMKVSIDTNEDTIDQIMENQSVVRSDVINSVRNLSASNINQESLSKEIKNNLNKRFKKNDINDVYFEKFLTQ